MHPPSETHPAPVRHHLTVDVEEFFHPTAMEPLIDRSRWDAIPRRTPALMERFLGLLQDRDTRGTFFVLGWLAEREPGIVRAIVDGGHEVACHGWDHRRVSHMTREEFREDVRRSRALLEDLSGTAVVGYRAPSFSILPGMEWAFDVLLDEGYRYDSSLFPVRVHPDYGYPDAPRDPYVLHRPGGALCEIPPATLRVAGTNLPAAGGAYLRFFPLRLLSTALASAARRDAPGTVYVHPWEWDPEMPAFEAPWLTQRRMRVGLGKTWGRIERLLDRFAFAPIGPTASRLLSEAGPRSA